MELNLSPVDVWFDPAIETYRINGEPGVRVSHVLDLWPKNMWMVPWVLKEMESHVLARLDKLHDGSSEPFYSRGTLEAILKEGKAAYKNKSQAALDVGSAAHQWIENFILAGNSTVVLPTDGRVLSCINAFLDWTRENQIEWVKIELPVAHAEYMYGGRIDALAIINGRFCLVDFKTSNRIYETYKTQVAAYQFALEYMNCPTIEERWILRFPKDSAGFEAKRLETNYEDDRDDFLAALAFYKRLNRRAA